MHHCDDTPLLYKQHEMIAFVSGAHIVLLPCHSNKQQLNCVRLPNVFFFRKFEFLFLSFSTISCYMIKTSEKTTQFEFLLRLLNSLVDFRHKLKQPSTYSVQQIILILHIWFNPINNILIEVEINRKIISIEIRSKIRSQERMNERKKVRWKTDSHFNRSIFIEFSPWLSACVTIRQRMKCTKRKL